jgi:MFS family permease
LSFLDRTNIGNARLAGLEADLGMKGLDYNIALAVFFPFYVAAEIPSNMMLKKLRPSVWFTIIMIAWAICTTLMGVVKDFPGLLAARMFLGIAEGGLFPGVTYYITVSSPHKSVPQRCLSLKRCGTVDTSVASGWLCSSPLRLRLVRLEAYWPVESRKCRVLEVVRAGPGSSFSRAL